MSWDNQYRTRSLSTSSYGWSSSPPRSPILPHPRTDRTRIESSPPLGLTLPSLDSDDHIPSIFTHTFPTRPSYFHSAKTRLPSFHSLFGGSQPEETKPIPQELDDIGIITDDEEFPSTSSAHFSASEDEAESDSGDREFSFDSLRRPVCFDTSSERGMWKTDPRPFIRKVHSAPIPSPPLPLASSSPITRPISVPVASTSDISITPPTAVPCPADRCNAETSTGEDSISLSSDNAPSDVVEPPSELPDLPSSPVLSSSSSHHEAPSSPLPPSSPPLSPIALPVSSPVLEPLTPLTSPLPSAPSSPLTEPFSDDIDIDVEDISRLSDDQNSEPILTPPTSPETHLAHLPLPFKSLSPEPSANADSRPSARPTTIYETLLSRTLTPDLPPSPLSDWDIERFPNSTSDPHDAPTTALSIIIDPTVATLPKEIDMVNTLQTMDRSAPESPSASTSSSASSAQSKRKSDPESTSTDQPPKKKPRKSKAKVVEDQDVMDEDFTGSSRKKSVAKGSRRKPKRSSASTSLPQTWPDPSLPELTPEEITRFADIAGMLIECMATSRASSLPLKTIYTTLVRNRPSLKEEKDEWDWYLLFDRVLDDGARRTGVFGKVESSVTSNSDKILEARWFYVPERDTDQDRATLIRNMMPGKRSETKKYKQYYFQPISKMVTEWEAEDAW